LHPKNPWTVCQALIQPQFRFSKFVLSAALWSSVIWHALRPCCLQFAKRHPSGGSDSPKRFARSGWAVYRFLTQHHPELEGEVALSALRRGKVKKVLAAAENAAGAFP
jgi:hypothetical protein